MIVISKKGILIGEVWFDEKPNDQNVDIIYYFQRSEPLNKGECEEFYTILIDLTKNKEELFKDCNETTRYEIRRAFEKDNLQYVFYEDPDSKILNEFYSFYDTFAKQKGLPKIWRLKFSQYKANKVLNLSCAKTKDKCLVWHGYYTNRQRVRLLFSASLFRSENDSSFRNLVSRANRFLHWNDILTFKNQGVLIYDMGGWYHGSYDKEKLNINKFKEGFGGTIVKNFNCKQALTLKGKIYLKYLKLREMLNL